MKKFYLSDRNIARTFLLPSILIVLLLDIYPILYVFFISFQSRGLFDQASNFVAFKNYITIFRNPNFLTALKNSLYWTIGTTSLEVIIGTVTSLLLNRDFKFRNIARGFLLVPYVIPTIVSALIWKYMFNDLIGVVNYVLRVLHLTNTPITFLSSPKTAMLVIITVNVWTYTPFVIISVLAALQNINQDMYDAAKVDGANNLQIFRHITIPSISPILVIVILLRTIWNFQKFDIIYLMTRGGPLSSTTTLPVLIYNDVFVGFGLARPAAVSIVVFIIMALVAILYIKLFEKTEKKVVG